MAYTIIYPEGQIYRDLDKILVTQDDQNPVYFDYLKFLENDGILNSINDNGELSYEEAVAKYFESD